MSIGNLYTRLKRLFLGSPIASNRDRHERLSIPLALAVFASDALSSTAYATEEILIALTASLYAVQANLLSLPVALAIAALMGIVVISYQQVINAYPQGGGTYEVSKDRLGILASQIAGGALLIDYVLTVAVSVSAGVANLTSTGWIDHHYRLHLAIIFLILIILINLRGVRESGKAFAVPAYAFIATMALLLVTGFYRAFTGDIPDQEIAISSTAPAGSDNVMSLALLFVLLNAFSHGCAALTGIEAISDGVKAFKEPVAKNANKTLLIMGLVLGSIFLGMTGLAYLFHIQPDHLGQETVVSQLGRAVFGDGSLLYYWLQSFTIIILILAANTSFSGFPRLAAILAEDGFLPRQLKNLGDKLVFSNGILILGVLSLFLIIIYQADTHALIPLYAVGVFLSFSLAQAGMVMDHLSKREPGWKRRLLINGVGALATGVVTIILAIEKWTEGAWMVIVLIALLILLFRSIRQHYQAVAKQLVLPETGYCPVSVEHTVLVLVSSLNKGTIPALEYAKTISSHVEAVHIELNPQATQRLRNAWDEWGCGIPLTILKSPYRSISEPLVDYIDEVEGRYEHNLVTIILPEFVTKKWWHNLLHNQTALLLKTLLRLKKGKVVTTVRYYLEE
ncbi:MAG: APC family permease [Vampirovibrio sp.]|nr:APC family permease [Vampirovibrio sp.]